MKTFSFPRLAAAIALALATVINFTALPASAQTRAAATTSQINFTATTAAGQRLDITTSSEAGTVEIKLKAGSSDERTFKFTAAELNALVSAVSKKQPVEGPLATTRDRLKEFRDVARAAVDSQALGQLTRQLDTPEFASAKAPAGFNDRATGLKFVKAAASSGSCFGWAMLDYDMCMIDYDDQFGCAIEAIMMLISCYLS